MFNPLIRLALLSLGLFGLASCGQSADNDDPAPSPNQVELMSSGALISATCSGCHSNQIGAMAALTDYSESQLVESLTQYKSETDGTTVMHRLARGYSDEDIAALSAYLGERG